MEKKNLKKKFAKVKTAVGIVGNSIVKAPAIGVGFFAFDEVFDDKLLFKSDQSEQRLIGPILIPNIDVLRKDKQTKEFYNLVFTVEDIQLINSLRQENKTNNFYNLGHDENQILEGIIDEEFWIISDSNIDKSKLYGFDLPVGTLMQIVKVKDKELFEKLTNEYKGFSLEAYFDIVDEIELENINKTKNKMEKNLKNLFGLLSSKKIQLSEIAIKDSDKILVINDETMDVSIDGETPENGDYILADDKIAVVMDGKLVEIKEPTPADDSVKSEEDAENLKKLNDQIALLTSELSKLKSELEANKSKFELEKIELNKSIEDLKKTRAIAKPDIQNASTSAQKSTPKSDLMIEKLMQIQKMREA